MTTHRNAHASPTQHADLCKTGPAQGSWANPGPSTNKQGILSLWVPSGFPGPSQPFIPRIPGWEPGDPLLNWLGNPSMVLSLSAPPSLLK